MTEDDATILSELSASLGLSHADVLRLALRTLARRRLGPEARP